MSEEAVAFSTAFQRLRDYIDDDVIYLEQNWKEEENLRNLMRPLYSAYRILEIHEEWSSTVFAPHVSHGQIRLRRDYERHWKRIVDEADSWELLQFLELGPREDWSELSAVERRRLILKETAEEEAKALENAIDILHDRFSDSEDDLDWLLPAERAWDTLRIACRLGLKDVLWRRRAIPFTLVPSHISNKYDSSDPTSLFRLIDQAARSYIFGAPLASLALQRSIMEQVLKQHFNGRGKYLEQVIESTRGTLDDIFIARLDRIRTAANAALHDDRPASSTVDLDELLFDGFITLRALIERATR